MCQLTLCPGYSPPSLEYAQVTKMLGNGRLEAQCFDGEKRLAHIRGKMRKKVRSTCNQSSPLGGRRLVDVAPLY